MIRDCAAKHPDDRTGEGECSFKLIAEPCTEKNNSNLGTADANCSRREYDAWEARLTQTYQKLMKDLDSETKTALREIERAWIVYRDKKCVFYQMPEQGTAAIRQGAYCDLIETGRQAVFLEKILGYGVGK